MVMLEEGVIDFDQTDVRGGATSSRSEQGRHLLRGPCARSPEPGREGEAGETKLAGGHSVTGRGGRGWVTQRVLCHGTRIGRFPEDEGRLVVLHTGLHPGRAAR